MRSILGRVRRTLPTLLTLVAMSGCASPRDRDCKALLPLLDERAPTIGSSILPPPTRPDVTDGGIVKTHFADAPREMATKLRAYALRDPAMREPVAALARATDDRAAAMASLDGLVLAMKVKRGEGLLSAVAQADAAKAHIDRLVQRCGILFRTPAQQALPDCVAIERAIERCVTPPSDDTTAEQQLLTCASAFAEVRSNDATTIEAKSALAAAMRSFEPFAHQVGASAREILRASKEIPPVISKQSAAREDADKASAAIRALCQSRSRR